MLRRKPLSRIVADSATTKLERHFGVWSLMAVGVGGTVGSGIFVLSGEVARTMAGPATCLSWLLAGGVCLLTALSYAELSCLIPTGGSTYIFAYHGLGEVWGVVGAWLLMLEYGVSGAAVSRSWGDKLAFWAGSLGVVPSCVPESHGKSVTCWINSLGDTALNPSAVLISIICTLVLLRGAQMGRHAINVLVVLKVGLVAFVIIAGFFVSNPDNLDPFIPPPAPEDNFVGGMDGVFIGATTSFFGYVGFDSVTCLSSEAINPSRTVPLSVLGTVISVAIMYFAASLALTAMVPYNTVSPEEGFGSAFAALDMLWATNLVMFGQIAVVLPTVIMVAYFPQSRLLYAMAMDGLLPSSFSVVDSKGNTYWGLVVTGAFGTALSGVLPFQELSEMISGGILLSFVVSNAALLVVRAEEAPVPSGMERLTVGVFSALCGVTAYALVLGVGGPMLFALLAVLCVMSLFAASASHSRFMPWTSHAPQFRRLDAASNVGTASASTSSSSSPSSSVSASTLPAARRVTVSTGALETGETTGRDAARFRVPFGPVLPGAAIALNWYLFAQLSARSTGLVMAVILCSILSYAAYGRKNSVGARTKGWTLDEPTTASESSSYCRDDSNDGDPLLHEGQVELKAMRRRPSAAIANT